MSAPAGETAAAPSAAGAGGFDLLRRATQAMMSKISASLLATFQSLIASWFFVTAPSPSFNPMNSCLVPFNHYLYPHHHHQEVRDGAHLAVLVLLSLVIHSKATHLQSSPSWPSWPTSKSEVAMETRHDSCRPVVLHSGKPPLPPAPEPLFPPQNTQNQRRVRNAAASTIFTSPMRAVSAEQSAL
ncbi:hypothetical protein QBC35DRAFT_468982 [Podospora australis]|uniref:Uncharacterized protein n=1 Tax=Podospora australis TaxID=1536484 RepID=A0AAN7ALN5_9PEZI|nr:hypothetical protein QBC35DRAFT_468982 [Podospora australis]